MRQDLTEARDLIEHNPSLGGALEQSVARLIRGFVPEHFEVTSGFAVNTAGTLSAQQDILILRNRGVRALSTYAGYGVFPIENVCAAIEVKTTLKAEHLKENPPKKSVSVLQSLHDLKKIAPDKPGESAIPLGAGLKWNGGTCTPFTAIFAFESKVASGTILRHMKEWHGSHPNIGDRINAVHVLDKSFTTWITRETSGFVNIAVTPQSHKSGQRAKPVEALGTQEMTTGSLRPFLASLLSFLGWYSAPPLDLAKYFLSGMKPLTYSVPATKAKP